MEVNPKQQGTSTVKSEVNEFITVTFTKITQRLNKLEADSSVKTSQNKFAKTLTEVARITKR